jgi:hypothetical protein
MSCFCHLLPPDFITISRLAADTGVKRLYEPDKGVNMAVHLHHEELVAGVSKQLKIILDKSPQAVYIYMDDAHKVCNQKMAELVGMATAKEWMGAEAPLADVVEEDQPAVIEAYENASEKMMAGHRPVRVKNAKTGKTIKCDLVIVPMVYEGHVFTVHFLSKI